MIRGKFTHVGATVLRGVVASQGVPWDPRWWDYMLDEEEINRQQSPSMDAGECLSIDDSLSKKR